MVRQPRSIWSPSNLSDALIKEQNKLIHLDPVPIFKDRGEIKFWLQKNFFPQGINLVIERSDNTKIIFKCKANARKKQQEEEEEGTKRNSKFFCPFRIRATYSIKLKKWNILIVNNVHSHELKFNPSTDEYRKFKNFLCLQNDRDTVKFFEELEYKTKLDLPISLPSQTQIMTCDCGLTSEVNWFNNIIIPEPSILNKPDIAKSKNNFVYKKKLISSRDSLTNDSLSLFLTNNNNSNNNTTNTTTTTTTTTKISATNTKNDMINLDEIDFTDMFKPSKKKKTQTLKDQTSKPSSSSSTFSAASPSSFPLSSNIIDTYPYSVDTLQDVTAYSPYNEIFSLLNYGNTHSKSTTITTELQNKHDEPYLVQGDKSWLDHYFDANQEPPPLTLSPSPLFQKNDILPRDSNCITTTTTTTTTSGVDNTITDESYLDFLNLTDSYPPISN